MLWRNNRGPNERHRVTCNDLIRRECRSPAEKLKGQVLTEERFNVVCSQSGHAMLKGIDKVECSLHRNRETPPHGVIWC